MHTEEEVYRLRRRVELLERKVEVILGELGLSVSERESDVPEEVIDCLREGNKISAI